MKKTILLIIFIFIYSCNSLNNKTYDYKQCICIEEIIKDKMPSDISDWCTDYEFIFPCYDNLPK